MYPGNIGNEHGEKNEVTAAAAVRARIVATCRLSPGRGGVRPAMALSRPALRFRSPPGARPRCLKATSPPWLTRTMCATEVTPYRPDTLSVSRVTCQVMLLALRYVRKAASVSCGRMSIETPVMMAEWFA